MAIYFAEAAAALLAGRELRPARLVAFEFASQTMRVWEGFGRLRTPGPLEWSGLGELGSIPDMDLGPGLPKTAVTFRLAVKPELLAMVPDQVDEVRGRRARIYLLFFDAAWQQLGAPVAVRSVIMDTLRRVHDVEAGRAWVEVNGEPLLATKHYPPAGRHTDADQQARFSGDKGHERGALYGGKQTVIW